MAKTLNFFLSFEIEFSERRERESEIERAGHEFTRRPDWLKARLAQMLNEIVLRWLCEFI